MSIPAEADSGRSSIWVWLAAVTSVVGLAGSLYLSLGMNLRACPLCFYQRTFVMGIVGIYAMGLWVPNTRAGLLSLLALPLAVGSLAVAAYHTYLESSGILECPLGVVRLGSAPQQSLALHILLVGFVALDVLHSRCPFFFIMAGIVLGGVFAFAGIKATPPAPIPETPYRLPVDEDGCRPPYRAASS